MAEQPSSPKTLDSPPPPLPNDRADSNHDPNQSSFAAIAVVDDDDDDDASSSSDPSLLSSTSSFSRLNAQAPEFVPRASTPTPAQTDLHQPQPRLVAPPAPPAGLVRVLSPPPSPPHSPFHVPIQGPVPVPVQNHHRHHHQHHAHYSPTPRPHHHAGFGDSEAAVTSQLPYPDPDHVSSSRNGLSEEATQKILNQASFYSDRFVFVMTRCLLFLVWFNP